MFLVNNKRQLVAAERTRVEQLNKANLIHRLERGKLNKEIDHLNSVLDKRDSKIETLESQLSDLQEKCDYYVGLENDREQIERDKKQNRIAAQDIKDDKAELEHREKRLQQRSTRLQEEENDEYKKGYSDGLADGLRKAHDITREDRKYMTMIAMAANQSEAIKASQKAIASGLKDDSADS